MRRKQHYKLNAQPFKELKGIEIADRKIKIRTEIESYLKSFNVYLDEMDKFENKQMMKKKLLVKNTWYV